MVPAWARRCVTRRVTAVHGKCQGSPEGVWPMVSFGIPFFCIVNVRRESRPGGVARSSMPKGTTVQPLYSCAPCRRLKQIKHADRFLPSIPRLDPDNFCTLDGKWQHTRLFSNTVWHEYFYQLMYVPGTNLPYLLLHTYVRYLPTY